MRTFKNWVQFLELNEEDKKMYSLIEETSSNDVESNFEEEVLRWLSQQKFPRNMKISLQYPIGSYKIDLALLDSQTNKYILGIEVDGFRYHSTTRQRYNDLVRQNFIESKGYKLIRVSELLWRTDKTKLLEMIYKNI